MQQSKRHSLYESITNIVVGYVVAMGSQLLIFPIFNIHIGIKDNILISLYFTAISIIRSYALRRWFTSRRSL